MSKSRRNDHPQSAQLSPEDARLLDMLIESDFDVDAIDGLSGDDRQRVHALAGIFNLLDDYPIDEAANEGDDELLVHATLARVRRAADAEAGRYNFVGRQEESQGRRFRIRLPDFISVAAIILIGVGVLWPAISYMRQRSIDAGCVNNLSALGTAFASYAGDYQSQVPVLTAGWGGGLPTWIDPYPLVQHGYCQEGHVNCPGHAHTNQPGYSRQLLLTGVSFRWGMQGSDRPIMGDRNPIIDARQSATMRFIDPTMNSVNHGKRGQNILFVDGSTRWLELPVVGSDDNIWLIRGQSEFNPGATPDNENDIFLVH